MLCFQYIFHPQVLCCYGKHLCTIPRDATYWTYQNRYVFWKWQKTFILKCEQNNKCDFSNFTWFLTGRSEDSENKVAQCRKLYSCRPLVCLLKSNVPVINSVFITFVLHLWTLSILLSRQVKTVTEIVNWVLLRCTTKLSELALEEMFSKQWGEVMAWSRVFKCSLLGDSPLVLS